MNDYDRFRNLEVGCRRGSRASTFHPGSRVGAHDGWQEERLRWQWARDNGRSAACKYDQGRPVATLGLETARHSE
jgi:hypothetical protein